MAPEPPKTPLLGDTIGDNLARTVLRVPGAEALVDVPRGRRWTYAELDADVTALACGLLAAGVKAGERIGIWAPNCPEWTLLQYATAKIGAVLVNVNPAYRSHELSYVLGQSGMRMIVSAVAHKTTDYRAMIDEVRPTETSPVSTMTRVDDDLARRTETVGRAMPHVEVKVVDPVTGRTVARGEPGELCTRGYSVMLGYRNEPEKTAMDDGGYLSIVGRIKDMVIRGGENVYPREIEEFLYTHPDIADVQVIGVPDVKYGEELMAWIVMRPGAEPLTAQDVQTFCEGRLAHYKVPRFVHVVEGFPMTVTGKVRKVEMRADAVEILGRADQDS
jgi:acyl-CoA synthetase (AMP-forming)/AMP-acid ligase II